MQRRLSLCWAMAEQDCARRSRAQDHEPSMINQRLLDHQDLLFLKRPAGAGHPGTDPAVAARVSEILLDIERGGEDALRRYSRDLDGWDPPSFELTRAEIARAEQLVDDDLQAPPAALARAHRGVRARPARDAQRPRVRGRAGRRRRAPARARSARVGAYLPAGRVPLLASPFMTVLVPKVAGVETVVACAPPHRGRGHLPVAGLQHRALRRRPHLRPRRRAGAGGDGVRARPGSSRST